ncbi:hypothetical protein O6H91_06G013000 [Diphasiastrum complanatum]|uniref:Uncharacterized protein n=1 Tax=Diphasiastrum complanatum TaxID=34168 RepID=A0ACC2DBA0_DIPCM|nr:hypothetical protein O6H91_06G013000 [Diphasiastrum complanatum]
MPMPCTIRFRDIFLLIVLHRFALALSAKLEQYPQLCGWQITTHVIMYKINLYFFNRWGDTRKPCGERNAKAWHFKIK